MKRYTRAKIIICMLIIGGVSAACNPAPKPIAQSTPLPTLNLSGVTAVGDPTVDQNDPLSRGEWAYDTYCAHCHGYKGEGEGDNINPDEPDSLGFMPVPRHDSKGHTWKHPDQLLKATVRTGIINPLYRYVMPAMPASALPDQQLDDILLYIKRWWTQEQRDFQSKITEQLSQAQKK
jgi:mono/diheme cytochrome c family protein